MIYFCFSARKLKKFPIFLDLNHRNRILIFNFIYSVIILFIIKHRTINYCNLFIDSLINRKEKKYINQKILITLNRI